MSGFLVLGHEQTRAWAGSCTWPWAGTTNLQCASGPACKLVVVIKLLCLYTSSFMHRNKKYRLSFSYLNYFDRWYDHAFLIPMKSFAALCDDRCYAGWLVSQLWQNLTQFFIYIFFFCHQSGIFRLLGLCALTPLWLTRTLFQGCTTVMQGRLYLKVIG